MWKKLQLNNIKSQKTNVWEKVSEGKTKFNCRRHQKTEETYLMGSDS